MVIGVLKEIKGNEYRVAAVPATVHEIVRHGHTVYVFVISLKASLNPG